MAWREGHSFKHELDIRDILISVQLGDDVAITQNFDRDYISSWTETAGEEVKSFWVYLQHLASLYTE
jgi:hypothetical protein